MTRHTQHSLTVAIAALLLALAAPTPAPAGPLTPPGPPAPTSVTLNELGTKLDDVDATLDTLAARLDARLVVNALPGSETAVHVIDVPGSYVLQADVIGETGKAGIVITASTATLDLNGFRVVGNGGVTGITASAMDAEVTIRNGSVSGWSAIGVAVIMGRATLEGIVVKGCFNTGISIAGGSIVRQCVSDDNGQFGFVANGPASFENCHASGNNQAGFTATGGTFFNCIATDNDGGGFGVSGTVLNCHASGNFQFGFSLGGGGLISGCTATGNTLHGIVGAGRSTIRGNVCTGNGPGAAIGSGIHVDTDCVVVDNQCSGNDIGVSATGTNNLIVRNACRGNPTANFFIAAGNTDGAVIMDTGQLNNPNSSANFAY